jgi:hypothetical protein
VPIADDYPWPTDIERSVTVKAFTDAFATVGFKPCADGSAVPGKEKLALFTKNGKPTHAAFSLPSGEWASKLGIGFDIEHRTPGGVAGALYGEPTHYFERPMPEIPRPTMPNVQAKLAEKYGLTANVPASKKKLNLQPKTKKKKTTKK